MSCFGVLATLLPLKKGWQHLENGFLEQQGQGSRGLVIRSGLARNWAVVNV
tara:strand:- start:1788 stop:1940 length:153 start_codon:yes stop_codon:yes gene_type:complete